ncbi:MAG: cysteine-rich CWC family protein, partial [Comamonas sp.]
CAITAGLPPESCWCMQTPVSKDALAQLPPEARGKACICPVCAQPVNADFTTD